ncbi:hypothetical protein [Metabacillus indicus]|uniref:hypothetical protein n=1 Tax=Metabacillus indicus TaxID=246786 RepID=UPI002490EDB4|nr:hypothetical protein [Metabacillus indicus]
MIRPNPFTIKIENQGWLCNDEYDELDLCSHGEIFLSVHDTIITQSSVNEEWGISESALALLRTLENDYCCDPELDEGLIDPPWMRGHHDDGLPHFYPLERQTFGRPCDTIGFCENNYNQSGYGEYLLSRVRSENKEHRL